MFLIILIEIALLICYCMMFFFTKYSLGYQRLIIQMYFVTNHYAMKTVCLIVNGLLESSYFTRHTFTRNTFTASVVDYVILNNLLSVI